MASPRVKWGRKKKDLLNAYQTVFGSPLGKTVLYDLMNTGHILTPTHDKHGPDGGLKNEGKREIVLYILTLLQTDPVKFLEQLRHGKTQEDSYDVF